MPVAGGASWARTAGAATKLPHPIRNVKSSSSQGVIRPNQAHTASAIDTISMKVCAQIIMLRRSTLSANAPAASASSTIGSATDACTSATMVADSEIESIIQEAPTDWIRPPKLESVLAPQTARKTG